MKALCIVTLVFGLSGCSNSEAVKRVKALADEACACADAKCAADVEARYSELVEEGQKRGSGDDRKEVMKAYDRMSKCLTEARAKAPADVAKDAPLSDP